jgi:hypothetical protein
VRLPKVEADGSAPIIKFTNFQRATRAPYVGYADFEAILVPLDASDGNQNTVKLNTQQACSASHTLIGPDDEIHSTELFFGERCAQEMLVKLDAVTKGLTATFQDHRFPALTGDKERTFQATADCHICSHPLKDDAVRDHCHVTGATRTLPTSAATSTLARATRCRSSFTT